VNGVVSRFLWDAENLSMELDANGNPLREYSYYPDMDHPHAMRRSSDGALFYYATEEPGHVVALVNASRQIVNSYSYEPFGTPISTSEQVPQAFRFAGSEYDAETGLYYMRARYYDPQLARFLSQDPKGVSAGQNGYVYVGNNPLNARDPRGLCSLKALVQTNYYDDGSEDQEILGIFPYGNDCGGGGGGTSPDAPSDSRISGLLGKNPLCDGIRAQMTKLLKLFKKDWFTYNKFQGAGGSDLRHRNELLEFQNGMRNNVKDYTDNGCDDDDDSDHTNFKETFEEVKKFMDAEIKYPKWYQPPSQMTIPVIQPPPPQAAGFAGAALFLLMLLLLPIGA
jgi:RHS repeat-associated protein